MSSTNLRKGLLQFIFSGSYMKRWNDKLRTMELIEIDKQAHKMIVAWMICQLYGQNMTKAELVVLEENVIEGGIFDYIFRLIITDIKPPIFYRIKENHEHYQELAQWTLKKTESHLRPLGEKFWSRFSSYILEEKHTGKAATILSAAHLYSSAWEFRLISALNEPFDDEIPDIKKRFGEQLKEYHSIPGMSELIRGLHFSEEKDKTFDQSSKGHSSSLSRIANLCGQLRFQKRWSQTPRTPETSVMGHMFLVACYSFFFSIEIGACPARKVNNFFCGLFHDFPELLTRDIISPVKKSFENLSILIRQYEEKELERRIFSPLAKDGYTSITNRLAYYLGIETGSEFHNTIEIDGKAQKFDFEQFHHKYNKNEYNPKDGDMIKFCDILAAYIEAYTAIRNGITSDNIQEAFWKMREENTKKTLGNLHIGSIFTDFD